MFNLKVPIFAFIVSLSLSLPIASADIYKYEDDEGVLHFTDTPTDHRFKIFMRDIKKDKLFRTHFRLAKCVGNPTEFEPIINSCALEFGVDKSLVKAVIHAESGYDPNAVSAKGASGLMQLMPNTARDLKVGNSFDPADNIRGGVRYLRFSWIPSGGMRLWHLPHTMPGFPGWPSTEVSLHTRRPVIMSPRYWNTENHTIRGL